MVPAGSLVDLGVPVALHSDFGMAPANPIYLAWTAMNRTTVAGDVFNPPRGLTRDEAMRAITIDAAYVRERLTELASDTDLSKYIL